MLPGEDSPFGFFQDCWRGKQGGLPCRQLSLSCFPFSRRVRFPARFYSVAGILISSKGDSDYRGLLKLVFATDLAFPVHFVPYGLRFFLLQSRFGSGEWCMQKRFLSVQVGAGALHPLPHGMEFPLYCGYATSSYPHFVPAFGPYSTPL